MIIVTAPTGKIGHHVAELLLAAGEAVRVIARKPENLAPEVRRRAEVVEGSHGDAAVIDRAFSGAEAVFWVAPPDPSQTVEEVYLDFTRPAAEALRRGEVKRVVTVTALGRGTPWQDHAGLVTGSIRMDDMIMATGVAFRGLALPGFMDNALQQLDAIKNQGAMFGPLDGDKKVPTTATRDMGAVAARLLRDRSCTGQADMPLLGPEDLSMNDMAAIISDVLGRSIRYQQITFDAFRKRLLDGGVSESFAQGYVEMMRAKNDGMDNIAERAPHTMAPTTFRQWCEEELKPAMGG